jgi:hypothetical protein
MYPTKTERPIKGMVLPIVTVDVQEERDGDQGKVAAGGGGGGGGALKNSRRIGPDRASHASS